MYKAEDASIGCWLDCILLPKLLEENLFSKDHSLSNLTSKLKGEYLAISYRMSRNGEYNILRFFMKRLAN